MFGPNTYVDERVILNYSHRDNHFFNIYKQLTNSFTTKFNLENYDILFIPGSGTVGIEAVMFSLVNKVKVIGIEGTFKSRWSQMASVYNKLKQSKSTSTLACRYETSKSQVFEGAADIYDCVSSFPYFDVPACAKVFVTCSNKQLGCLPGLSIVGVRKDCWNLFMDDSTVSYLNLSRYKAYSELNQTPTTAPTHLFEMLLSRINNINILEFRQRVDRVCSCVSKYISKNLFVGNYCGPVITIPKSAIPTDFAKLYDLYGYTNMATPNYQIFTYSQQEKDYDEVLSKL